MKSENLQAQDRTLSNQPFDFDFSRRHGWPANYLKSTKSAVDSENRAIQTEIDPEILDRAMELRAATRVSANPYLRQHCDGVHFYFEDGCLIVGGRVASFYLKQLIQETVRKLEGVDRVENRLNVEFHRGPQGP